MANLTHILLADDDSNDVVLLRRSLQAAGVVSEVKVVRNGVEAVDYLAGRGKYADRASNPLPDLMLLDLKMPRLDGFDVLVWWREQGRPGQFPIIVLSGSALQQDIDKARLLGASAYRVKPPDADGLSKLAQELRDYWLTLKPGQLKPGTCNGNLFYPGLHEES